MTNWEKELDIGNIAFVAPAAMERLLPDGSWRAASFDTATGLLSETVLPAEPAVFCYAP